MMDNIEQFPKGNYGVEFIGPFAPQWDVSSGGYKVPYLTASVNGDEVHLSCDRRFSIHGKVTIEEARRWIPFIANCMAVAAGYSCHGENCQPINEHKVRLSEISLEETQ